MSNDPHNILNTTGTTPQTADASQIVPELYELAHGLRYLFKCLYEQEHDASAIVDLTSKRLLEIASDLDEACSRSSV